MLLYQEIAPDKRLANYILSYWKFEYHPNTSDGKPPETLDHTVLPDGCVSLVFHYNQHVKQRFSVLFGPRMQNYNTQVFPGSVFVGVRFFPGVVDALFGISGAALRNQSIDAGMICSNLNLGKLLESICKNFDQYELFDEELLPFITKFAGKPDERIIRAVSLIVAANGNIKMADIAGKVHLSERQLQRIFREKVGLTPKEFARIRRIRTSLIKMVLENRDLQEVIHNAGYFDQAHFIRDFGAIAGTNPTLFKKYISQIDHRNISPPDAQR